MNQSASYARKAHILTLLKSGKAVTVPSIMESLAKITLQDGTKLECVSKTVIRDIKDLKDMGCPIFWRRSLDSYELRDMSWDMPATPLLGCDEILAVAVGTQFGAATLPKEVARSVRKVGTAIFDANTDQFYHGADIAALKILVPPVAPEAEGIFATVYEAWSTRHLLTIVYADEKGEETKRTIEPQALLFHEMVWYIRAYCYLRSCQRTFAVSRIEKATIEEATFSPRPDLYEGITFDTFDERAPYKDIVILLSKSGRQFALAHVLHSKQKITRNDDGTYTMTAPQKARGLAVQWILSQRGEATPVAPAELVDDVQAKCEKILNMAKEIKNGK